MLSDNGIIPKSSFVVFQNSPWDSRRSPIATTHNLTSRLHSAPAVATLPRCLGKANRGANNSRLAAGLWLAQAHAMALAGVFPNASASRLVGPVEGGSSAAGCLSSGSRGNSWTLPSISVDGWESSTLSPRSTWSPQLLRSTNQGSPSSPL